MDRRDRDHPYPGARFVRRSIARFAATVERRRPIGRVGLLIRIIGCVKTDPGLPLPLKTEQCRPPGEKCADLTTLGATRVSRAPQQLRRFDHLRLSRALVRRTSGQLTVRHRKVAPPRPDQPPKSYHKRECDQRIEFMECVAQGRIAIPAFAQ